LAACVLTLWGCGSGAGSAGTFNGDDGGLSSSDATSPGLLGDATINPDGSSSCIALTCADQGFNCGPAGDGCGNLIQCGSCTAPQTCGGGGKTAVCGGNAACVPATCTSLAATCGEQGDGCGNTFDCGKCTAPQTCGGGGMQSVCGGNAACIPLKSCGAGANCGSIGDGCGGLVDCSGGVPCPPGTVCGGGGTHYVCGASNLLPDGGMTDGGLNACSPIAQSTACGGINCGIASDGCGGSYNCGTCTAPETCGGGGISSVCGGNSGCVPLKVCPGTMNCSVVADGCGGLVNCAPDGGTSCPPGETCGGGGSPNVCGAKNVLPDGGIIDGGLNVCTPVPQASACGSLNCGLASDGCGGTYNCGTCTAPQTCGGGGTPSVCGGNSGCVPLTNCLSGMNCGVVADGCGGVVACGGACPGGELCGGGGQANVCGAKNILPDGGIIDGGLNVCVPIPQATACAGYGCGQTGDGCGNIYNCGVTCPGQQTCGGGGVPFQCGQPACTPLTACPAGVQCGTVADGCGGTINCGGCTAPATCGGGGTSYKCGTPSCVPATTCPAGVNCGPWPDGCGGVIASCGPACTSPNTCGGGGVASQCGHPACVPITKCPAPANCGTWPDGCGGSISCGNCAFPEICGGSGVPSVCGGGLADGGSTCSGVSCYLNACDGGTPTSISGHVYDPAGHDGLYNVVVYVPQSRPSPFAHGPSCDSCGSLYTGNPLVATTTDATGAFQLNNVPVMADMPIVLQIGKWRRQMAITQTIVPCQNNVIADTTLSDGGIVRTLRLPGKEVAAPSDAGTGPWEGPGTIDDLPQIAISTGGADTLECLLDRIGVDSSEYTAGSGGTGHLHIFQGSPSAGAPTMAGAPRSFNSLWDTYADLTPYDVVVLSCEGAETTGTGGALSKTELGNLYEYANNGGRVFASHFHYAWFNKNTGADGGSFGADNLATWTTGANAMSDPQGNTEINATVVQSLFDGGAFVRGQALFTFLQNTGALGNAANVIGPKDGTLANELNIQQPKHNADVSSANTASQPWLVADSDASVPHATEYFSFDTPVGGEVIDGGKTYCGRVVFSDLHVGSAVTPADKFSANVPAGCTNTTLSPQEKALEFMLFDLSSCVSSDTNLPNPPSCTPLTACPASVTCGSYPNGCGTGNLNCGSCEGGASCVNGTCVSCVPQTACPAGVTCGEWPDGCGGILQCGTCSTGSCVNGTCETGCKPQTCASQGITCGQAGDGCGNALPGVCGTCNPGQSCIGGTCVSIPCNKVSCATLGLSCGPAGDGCGGTQNCGVCTVAGQTCGGGGTPGVCGEGDANLCTPLTCPGQGIQCGPAGDGCGNLIACGPCTVPGQTCGGGGTPGVCGAPNCTPLGCGSLQCGATGDGCGGIISCGTCAPPQTCGGGGTPGVCGQGDANACQPLGCGSIKCGSTGDGCGGVINCGTCTPPQTCGGGGTPGVCGSPTCTPLGCGSLKCGPSGDGCGGTLNCGTCTPPETCGGGGTPGVCGQGDANACVPSGCGTQQCGSTGDGCGGLVNCGTCTPPQTCGGGGVAGACGAPTCTPKTCTELGATCGQVADGCGGLTPSCGTCTGSATCGGGGTANQCGSPNCTVRTCAQAGANCGPVADGCGGIIQCGTCTPPDTCGGGGVASQCGTPSSK
jgi:hypothetical protein